MIPALVRGFGALEPHERRHVTGVALAMALYCFHALWFSTWVVEDAAISYAFAENFAHGEGFVAFPGGEPVEGFSNPSWTLLLALTSFFGLSPWFVAKVLGVGFGLVCVPLSWLWARRMAPEDTGNWVLLAPLAVAMSTQHTQWAASGLENGLFNLLLAGSAVRIFQEGDRARWGLSGLLLGALAITRPEAPLYAAVIAAMGAGPALQAGGIRWLASWTAAGLGPFAGWHAWAYHTFAWELPNTYYAKLTEEKFQPLEWDKRGWAYLRNWALHSVHGFVVPLFTLGQSGVRGWAGTAGLGLTGLLLGVLFVGLGWPRLLVDLPAEPVVVMQARLVVIGLALGGLPLLGIQRRGALPRMLAWTLTVCALFFAVYTGGDWMRGYRWLSMAAVPLSVLLADACRELGAAVQPLVAYVLKRPVRPITVAVALALPVLGGGVGQTAAFMWGLETTPFDVRRRVLYMKGVQERLHLDHASLLEVDMGAHMYWSGFELFDMAGLVNVPIARHHYDPAFLDAYLHEQNRPTFAHVHGGWAGRTRIDRRPWFNREYIEIPGYVHSPTKLHIGNHIRKDLFIDPKWPGSPGRRWRFGDLVLEGIETPAPVVHPGGTLYVEVGWSIERRVPGFRALLFLTDGERFVVKELPPAYDWMPIPRWRRFDVYMGRHTLTLPDDLPAGTWDLGIVVIGDDVTTAPSAAVPIDAGGQPETGRVLAEARFMAGEARLPGAITVTDRAGAERAAEAELAATVNASTGDCDAADAAWSRARRFFAADDPWHAKNDPVAHDVLAACWARRAESDGQPASIARARSWDHHQPEVLRVGRVLADRWEAEADRAHAAGDEEAAFQGWLDVLTADPSRTWVRRRAELLRADLLAEESP